KRYHVTFIAQAPIGSIGTGNESGYGHKVPISLDGQFTPSSGQLTPSRG
ncbi:Uncharacterized protein APZ42_010115, partial [Daphnia magna]